MLKKVGLVAVLAVAGALTASAVAFADGYTLKDKHFHHPIQKCEKSILSGILTIPHDDDSSNKSDHDGDCDQDD